jgi:hypothetical protein
LVAFTFDSSNKINGSFELLPHVLSSKVLKTGDDGHLISGPYTHWTELGVIEWNGSLFYRASFVGRSTKTNQQRLLCVAFDENNVNLAAINWPTEKTLG